jgi:hypothetical protein
MSDIDDVALAEAAEAESMYTYGSMTSPLTRATLGIATARIGGGVVLSMRNDVTGYWSKALGFGFTEPVTATLVDAVVDFYRAERAPVAVLQIAPVALPPRWTDIVRTHGLQTHSSWLKLACPVSDIRTRHHTDLRVGPVEPADYRHWAVTTLQALGMPEYGLVDMLIESLPNPGFHPVAAWDGDHMVAAANLFLHRGVGSLHTSATLPSHRNRGAQSALIALRARMATEAGCRLLFAETGEPAPGTRDSSFDNLGRSGFRALYARQNWIWTA